MSSYSHKLVRKLVVEQADATTDPGLPLTKLKDGSPSVFKLHMTEEMRHKESMIARQSLGTPNRIGLGETEKVLMVVGATGAGKTTLINGMVNYILGVQWKDEFRFKGITEETEGNQAYSQTQDITAYTFHPMTDSNVPYTFTVIDTPGYGGTEGLERDKKITEQIKEFFSLTPPSGVDHLDGVGFVVAAFQARLTLTQKYIFDSILSIFGKDFDKNIFMMIAFADNQPPAVLQAIKEAKIPSHSEKHFKFNNLAPFAENDTKNPDVIFNERAWKMCMDSFKNFFEELAKADSVSLTLTQEVLEERHGLHVLIEGLNVQITRGLNKLEEMRQEENVLQEHEKEIETNKDFTYTVNITKPVYTDLRGTRQHTTTCKSCQATCHTNCKINDDTMKYTCVAMDKRGNCRICPGKCNWSKHSNLPYLIKYETITETRTAEHLKKKYHKAVEQKATSKQMMKEIEESLQVVHDQLLKMIKEAHRSLNRLDEIALKPNPVTSVKYLELLIESEKREAKPLWRQRIQYLKEGKRAAETLYKVKNEKERQELVQTLARGESLEELSLDGDRFYSKFKFLF